MPEAEPHYYAYESSAENDPYVLPNGVLINKLGLTTTADLEEAEAEFVLYRTAELWEQPVEGLFNLAHLQEIHRRLFQDVYPWAGRVREVDIGKGDTVFMHHGLITAAATQLFTELDQDELLHDLPHSRFCERAAMYLGRLNYIHPFREGNGRTQREFMGQLAQQAGFYIDWSGCSPASMRDACISAQHYDFRPMTRILRVGLSELPPEL